MIQGTFRDKIRYIRTFNGGEYVKVNKIYPINQRIHNRINRTKEYETKLSLWITIAALLMTMFLALLIAYGLPTGPTWIDYIRNLVLAICLHSILFLLFSFLISLILSF